MTHDPSTRVGTPAPDIADLDPLDHLLTTTKQVRKRLDLERPVPRELILECIDIAQHAPMGGNFERNRWLVIDDPELKAEVAERYERAGRPYLKGYEGIEDETTQKVVSSAQFLVDHMHEVPAQVLAMRLDKLAPDAPNFEVASYHGSVAPGIWSFQLAARARGLGTAWTTLTLPHEDEIAELLGIPESVTQVALLPVGWYKGDSFTPATRRPARDITYFNGWRRTLDDG